MKKLIKDYILITIGVILIAVAIEFFLSPNKIAAGGVTGIAIILHYIFPGFSVGALMLYMNIILFIIAFIVIGNQFGAKTIYASLSLSGIIWVMDKFLTPSMIITHDLLLASLFGTGITAVGMGIVFNVNASTGGTDILAKILNKFIHINIGKSLLVVDFIVTIAAGVTFGAESGMYALLCVVLNGFAIDAVIEGLNISKQIIIMSLEYEVINKYIIEDLGRGSTIFHGIGGFTRTDKYILFTVLNRKEFIKLKNYIKEIDPKAFISVGDAHEVLGEGFKDIAHD